MIRRVRFRAPLYIAWGLFFLAWTIAARATTPVLESHMREFVYWTIGVVIFSLVGAGGAFVSYLNARMERSFERAIGRLEKNVEDLERCCGRTILTRSSIPSGAQTDSIP